MVAWSDGGRTVADNLTHLCRHHHVVKHQSVWRSTLGPDGVVTWTSPTGRTHHDPPADPAGPGMLDRLEPDHPSSESPETAPSDGGVPEP
ncbi:HNH endonuclease signature motif containing protein [Isoptericola sp. NPDC019482]|uniref:HNH endonuclease signature motif containing protein n=1 Tax=Isoptericola sp. NPDC019482 TaxID=3154688 RepID=UPI00348AE1FB